MVDSQLKRGLLDICVLAVLLNEDSYGYKIIRDLNGYVQISESTLYPILKRLESSGCLNVYSIEHSGRLRKFYHLTETGKSRIPEFLSDFEDILKIHDFITKRWRS